MKNSTDETKLNSTMEKKILCLIFLLVISIAHITDGATSDLDFYSFTVMDIDDNIISLEQYRGKVSLVVNVASHCGYTDTHYKSLVRITELLEDTNMFNVLAFPCNQFGRQEPGSNFEIYRWALEEYQVNFPMFAKVDVKGQNALDAWNYLSEQSGHEPDWNFWKYLVDHDGKVVDAWGPWVVPDKLYSIISSTISRAQEAKAQKAKEQEAKEQVAKEQEATIKEATTKEAKEQEATIKEATTKEPEAGQAKKDQTQEDQSNQSKDEATRHIEL